MLFLEIQEIGWELSLKKIIYNLTKRTTKTEEFEKYFEMFIKNFKTICYKLTASGNIIHSILKYKLMRLISKLRLPNKQKQAKTATSRKKLIDKSVEGVENWSFQ